MNLWGHEESEPMPCLCNVLSHVVTQNGRNAHCGASADGMKLKREKAAPELLSQRYLAVKLIKAEVETRAQTADGEGMTYKVQHMSDM